ncbi:MAG: GAF domain-containing protein, partial [Bacteroidia bacterium]|nr:GAF domain-containing protein [Bacteroidia bacterium]
QILPQISALLEGETDLIANMANVTAVLKQALGFFWIGFYRRVGEELVLAPFQGTLACTRIRMGKGVCGTSALKQETILVPDVHQFPGHIACSAISKSEIVVPYVKNGFTSFVLDIDSDKINDFSETDKEYLEHIVRLLGDSEG